MARILVLFAALFGLAVVPCHAETPEQIWNGMQAHLKLNAAQIAYQIDVECDFAGDAGKQSGKFTRAVTACRGRRQAFKVGKFAFSHHLGEWREPPAARR